MVLRAASVLVPFGQRVVARPLQRPVHQDRARYRRIADAIRGPGRGVVRLAPDTHRSGEYTHVTVIYLHKFRI